tara:strand:- start:641 stop:1012 length:372 start_codon:yes stop_codon:yes gene_type:complete
MIARPDPDFSQLLETEAATARLCKKRAMKSTDMASLASDYSDVQELRRQETEDFYVAYTEAQRKTGSGLAINHPGKRGQVLQSSIQPSICYALVDSRYRGNIMNCATWPTYFYQHTQPPLRAH